MSASQTLLSSTSRFLCNYCRSLHIQRHIYLQPLLFGTAKSLHRHYSTKKDFSTSLHVNLFEGLRLQRPDQKAVNKVVSDAEKIVGYPTSFLSLRCLLSDELSNVAMQMRKLVGTNHPLMKTARGMMFNGKHSMQMRGLLVMLIAKAAGPNPDGIFESEKAVGGIYNSQRSLAEITEVIHTANLIHKGVVNLDKLPVEDGPVTDMEFGNKMAVLSGDYFLASACSGLADLENPKVVEIVASAIGDIMMAEFTNFTDACGNPTIPESCTFSDWLRQTYLSLGSLLAKSCQAALMLSGHSDQLQNTAYSFGKNLIFSHQLSQDILPFLTKEERQNLSLSAAPVILYKESVSPEEFSHIQRLWDGGHSNYDEIVAELSKKEVVDMCRTKCQEFQNKAVAAVESFPDSDAKSALIRMVKVISDT